VGKGKQGLGTGCWRLWKANSQFGQDVGWAAPKKQKDSSKMHDQSGKVIENKGLLWKTLQLSGNVIEKKTLTTLKRECCSKEK
jgi:hypothetical protein